mgnify:FL=1|tara:strand:- start:813 stop:1190 length:378 start_codon:yes stop_codon:yes gene_type:complete
MATLTKHLFSEIEAISSRRFVVKSTEASAANIFHVTPNTNSLDEMWIYAHNFGAADIQVSFMWGLTSMPSTSATDIHEGVDITVPFKSGRALIFDGVLMSHGLSAAAYANTAGSVSIDGFVNRIT